MILTGKHIPGQICKFICNKHPWIDLISPMIIDFEKLTGIKVELSIFPEDQFRAKLGIELVSEISDATESIHDSAEQDMINLQIVIGCLH